MKRKYTMRVKRSDIENRLSVADKLEESISQCLQQAEALRQSILKQAFEARSINFKFCM